MTALLAQRVAKDFRHFDVADGFAITLIAMLFMVLAGVVVVARCFVKREKRTEEADSQALEELLNPNEVSPETPSSRQVPSCPADTQTWERDADWWRPQG